MSILVIDELNSSTSSFTSKSVNHFRVVGIAHFLSFLVGSHVSAQSSFAQPAPDRRRTSFIITLVYINYLRPHTPHLLDALSLLVRNVSSLSLLRHHPPRRRRSSLNLVGAFCFECGISLFAQHLSHDLQLTCQCGHNASERLKMILK